MSIDKHTSTGASWLGLLVILCSLGDVSCINRVVRGHRRCWHAARAAAFRKPTALRPRRHPAKYPSPLYEIIHKSKACLLLIEFMTLLFDR